MANETNETVVVKEDGVAKKALKTANETAATLRKVIKRLEEVMGLDIDGDGKLGKAGHVKLTALIGVAVVFAALTGGLFAANELVWKIGDSAYADAEGDATFNSVTLTGEAKVDGKYAAVGPNATTGLMVQTGTCTNGQTKVFTVAFGAAPVVLIAGQTTNQAWRATTVTASQFVVSGGTTAGTNSWIAIGSRP